MLVGNERAHERHQRNVIKRAEAIQKAHDGWLKLGIDTRQMLDNGEKLPPGFMKPPTATTEEWIKRIEEILI